MKIEGEYTGVILGTTMAVTEEQSTAIRRELTRIFPGKIIFAVAQGLQSVAFTVRLPDGAAVVIGPAEDEA